MIPTLRKVGRGFTIVELLIVVAIVAILTAIALPLYQQQVRKSARQQAKAVLMQIAQLEERYYTANNTYLADIGTLLTGTSAATVYAGGKDYLDATDGKHKIVLAAGSGTGGCTTIDCGFKLTADLNGSWVDPTCLSLTLNSTGVRGFTGSGTAKDCW